MVIFLKSELSVTPSFRDITPQDNTVQYNTTQYNTIQYNYDLSRRHVQEVHHVRDSSF